MPNGARLNHRKELSMKTLHLIPWAFAAVATASTFSVAWADQPLQRTDLLKSDIGAAGYETVQTRVDFAPGALAPKHSHPGEEIAYVLEGTLQYDLAGQKPVTLSAGQSLFIPAGVVHSAKNLGAAKASELATYIVLKGKPLVVLEKG
jgi:quercetin dioxygenase-like cupin family protein